MRKKWLSCCGVLGAVMLFGMGLVQPCLTQAGGTGDTAQPQLSSHYDYTDQLIVKYRDPSVARATVLSSAHVAALRASAGVKLSHLRAMSGDAHVVKLAHRMTLAEVETIVKRLNADPAVEYAEPDRLMFPLLTPNDPWYPNQWHYKTPGPPDNEHGAVNMPGAWDITTGSNSIVVAVIDTGILPNHVDISGRLVPGYDFIHDSLVANDGDGRDADPSDPGNWITAAENASGYFAGCPITNSSWHGTHVAGTIGAATNNNTGVAGINWVSKILPVRVLGKCGGYISDILDGARWAAGLSVTGVPDNAHAAKVLNLSLGGSGACSTTFQTAVNDIIAAGATIVVAAGNSNSDASNFAPANCNGVISVAAVNRSGGRASYSNYGTIVKIAAPGGQQSYAGDPNGVLSTFNSGTTSPAASPGGDSYVYYQGTSMAAPHVTGIASLMLSRNPTLTPSQILSVIQTTARAFPAGTGMDCTTSLCGSGIIDAAAAVAGVLPLATLYGDFASYGLYSWNGSAWALLNTVHPALMAASGSILYADFPGYGLYSWNGTTWTLLNTVHPALMTASGSQLYADFAGYGLYSWNGTTWTLINTVHPSSMAASDSTLYADFLGYGLYSWNGTTWTLINTVHPARMAAAGSILYADFSGYGLYSWNGSAWTQINTVHPTLMTAAGSQLYADFAGYGLYSWNGSAWTLINTVHPASMAAAGSILYADFGGYGLYSWNGTSWTQLNTVHPSIMVAGF